jgi:short-subunit dehydrogenase
LFQLARLGIDIILISRTKTKLEAVAAEIGMNKRKHGFLSVII